MSKQHFTDSSPINWQEFLTQGFLIQKPHSHTIWGGYGQSDFEGLSFFHRSFYGGEARVVRPKYTFELDKKEFVKRVKLLCPEPVKLRSISKNNDELVMDLQSCLEWVKAEPSARKLVPHGTAYYQKSKGHPLASIDKFGEIQGWIFGFWDESSGVLGCSPEYLALREGKDDVFMALAGTTKIAGQSLLNSAKDLKEHELVIKDIEEKLKQLGYYDIVRNKTLEVSYGELKHLMTKLSATLPDTDFLKLIGTLHPTAALGGYPSESAQNKLRELICYKQEKEARLFGGVFGCISPSWSTGLVMIRNIQWSQDQVCIHSGCGVIADSKVQSELTEIENKRASIEKVFQ